LVASSVERGIEALKTALQIDNLNKLRQVNPNKGEIASFEFSLPADYLGIQRILRISFTENFPNEKLKLSVSPSPWLEWPHAEHENLCLFGFDSPPPIGVPEDIVNRTLTKFEKLWNLVKQGSSVLDRKYEFKEEISTYWYLQLPLNENRELVLLDHPLNSCELCVLTDPRSHQNAKKQKIWISSTVNTIEHYYSRVIGHPLRFKHPSYNAFHLALTTYPNVKIEEKNLLAWIQPHVHKDDYTCLQQWFHKTANEQLRWIFLSLPDKNSQKILPIALRNIKLSLKQQIYFGARYGKKRQQFVKQKVILESSPIHLLYPESVYSRNLKTQNDLKNKSILMVGVGSLGSFVANLLIRAGVGKLILIDPDKLSAGNIGRHLLGLESLGQFKAKALKAQFLSDLPNSNVSAICTYLQVEMIKDPFFLNKVDVIINTTADWATEYFLWEKKSKSASWGLIQGWSEPYGYVGHALLSPGCTCSDARYLFASNGRFEHRFTEWPNNGFIKLPACGEGFLPGGITALNSIASMIAQSTIDFLTQPNNSHIWYSLVHDRAQIIRAGGQYIGPAISEECNLFLFKRDWPNKRENNE